MSLRINEAVIWQESGEGISLYDTESGDFRTLNESAAKIWVLVADDGDRELVATRLALLFGGSDPVLGARIRQEVDEFVTSMIDAGLIEEVHESEGVGVARPHS